MLKLGLNIFLTALTIKALYITDRSCTKRNLKLSTVTLSLAHLKDKLFHFTQHSPTNGELESPNPEYLNLNARPTRMSPFCPMGTTTLKLQQWHCFSYTVLQHANDAWCTRGWPSSLRLQCFPERRDEIQYVGKLVSLLCYIYQVQIRCKHRTNKEYGGIHEYLAYMCGNQQQPTQTNWKYVNSSISSGGGLRLTTVAISSCRRLCENGKF